MVLFKNHVWVWQQTKMIASNSCLGLWTEDGREFCPFIYLCRPDARPGRQRRPPPWLGERLSVRTTETERELRQKVHHKYKYISMNETFVRT